MGSRLIRDLLGELQASMPLLALLSGPTAVYIGIGCAPDVARWLAANGYAILGIEGFSCDGTSVKSLTDFIADFSSIAGAGPDRRWLALDAANVMLARWGNGVAFVDFTIKEA